MDTELLVEDQIEDGRELINRLLTIGFNVDVAFWLKLGEDASWRLYLALTGFDPEVRHAAFSAVFVTLDNIHGTSISPADITLIDPTSPQAKAAIELRDRSRSRTPRIFHDKRLGDLFAKEAYIYPPPPLRQAFIVSYVKRPERNEWEATTLWAESYRGLSAKGTVSYSAASWLGEKPEDATSAQIRVLIEVNPEFDLAALHQNADVATALLDQAEKTADEAFKARHPGADIRHVGALPVAG